MIAPSTKAFAREARRQPRFSFFDFLHGYVYGRWPYLYIGIGTGEHPLARIVSAAFDGVMRLTGVRREPKRGAAKRNGERSKGITFADTYHGKVVPLAEAAQLVSVDRDVTIRDLEHVIPYAVARDIVLRDPDHITVLQCPCRTARKNPCKPLDVCLVVGEPFAGFILEHHPGRSRRITPAEAVEILRQEDERGHVHHAFFKDAMLGRFYAICNCCKCCCGAMQAHRSGTPMLASSGFVARVDHALCVACGTCAKYCQFDAVRIVDGLKSVDAGRCMGCGVCIPKCRQHALTLQREPDKGIPLELAGLMAEAIEA